MHPNEWKQSGKIYLWRYESNPRNYRGWHLNCDETGCDSLTSLISSFSELEESERRTVLLSKPTSHQLAVPGCNQKALSDERLVIGNSDQWALRSESGKTYLNICQDHIPKMIQGISEIKVGKGDRFIGKQGNEIWFWWDV